jgi:hypothetical protein
MDQYCDDALLGVEDFNNAIALRADIHKLFDAASFMYVPKYGQMRLHFIFTRNAHLYTEYQNSYFSTRYISFQFLFARFAWAVFQNFQPDQLEASFGPNGIPKRGRDEDAGNDSDGDKHRNSRPRRKPPRETKQLEPQSKKANQYPVEHVPIPSFLVPCKFLLTFGVQPEPS